MRNLHVTDLFMFVTFTDRYRCLECQVQDSAGVSSHLFAAARPQNQSRTVSHPSRRELRDESILDGQKPKRYIELIRDSRVGVADRSTAVGAESPNDTLSL
jgi:hypothetical protein